MKQKPKKPAQIAEAEDHLGEARAYLKEYINDRIEKAGSIAALCKETNTPRSTIVVTLRRGNILGLRCLAYRLAGLGRPKERQGGKG